MARKKVTTKKKFTNLIIIDASGSMQDKAVEVIGGLKKLFSDIKEDAIKNPEVESTTIVVDFSSAKDYRVLVNSNDPSALLDSIAMSYTTRGLTALYDAIGFAFAKVPDNQDGVFVNILTDGEENDSKEFKNTDIKKLIEDKKANKWGITFMGTTEDCLNHAISLGISKGNTIQFTNSADGTGFASSARNLSRTAYYFATVSTDSIDLDNLMGNSK